MPYYVYILRSLKDKKYYIGSTSNVEARLKFHNAGLQRSTGFLLNGYSIPVFNLLIQNSRRPLLFPPGLYVFYFGFQKFYLALNLLILAAIDNKQRAFALLKT